MGSNSLYRLHTHTKSYRSAIWRRSITQKNKIYAVIGILALLSISFIGGYVLAPIGSNYTISQGIYPRAEYTIWRQGSTYYAKDDMGAIDYQGTNATEIINDALNALTAGRTYKEKVVLIGNFEVDSPIQVSSYTILEIDGKITLSSGSNVNIIENANPIAGDSDIEIYGGELDGNKANQASGTPRGIDFMNVTRGLVDSIYIHDTYDRAIRLMSNNFSKIINSWALNSGHYQEQAFTIDGNPDGSAASYYCSIENTYAENSTDIDFIIAFSHYSSLVNVFSKNPTGGSVEIFGSTGYDTTNNFVDGLVSENANLSAIGVNKAWQTSLSNLVLVSPNASGISIAFTQTRGVVVNNALIVNPQDHGVHVLNGAKNVQLSNIQVINTTNTFARGIYVVGTGVYDVIIEDVIIINANYRGIDIESASRVIIGDSIVNGTATNPGIYLNNATQVLISNTHSFNNADWGLVEFDTSDFNVIVASNFRDNPTGGIQIVGADTNVNLVWNSTTWIP